MNLMQQLISTRPLGGVNPFLAVAFFLLIAGIVARWRNKRRMRRRAKDKNWKSAIYNPKQYRSRR